MKQLKTLTALIIITLGLVLAPIREVRAGFWSDNWHWLLPVGILAGGAIAYTIVQSTKKDDSSGGNISKYSGTIKLMPIGDSITQGSAGGDVRCQLWQKLSKINGVKFDFVGNVRGYFGGGEGPNCDNDHEAHFGWTANQVNNIMSESANKHKPDMAIIHLGTNNVRSGHNNDQTVSAISQIIDKLRASNAKVVIFVAGIIPDFEKGTFDQTQNLNSKISQMATGKNNSTSPVIFVDQYTGFTQSDTFDKLHPNNTGAHKIATKWENAIINYLR